MKKIRSCFVSLTLIVTVIVGFAMPFLFSSESWNEFFLLGMKTTSNFVVAVLNTPFHLSTATPTSTLPPTASYTTPTPTSTLTFNRYTHKN